MNVVQPKKKSRLRSSSSNLVRPWPNSPLPHYRCHNATSLPLTLSMNPSSSLLSLLSLLLLFSSALSFQSDEFLHHDDDEFEGIRSSPDPAYVSPPVRRRPDLDLSSASESKSVQFTLEHALGDSDFSVAGTFTARLKSWTHGGQVLSFSSYML